MELPSHPDDDDTVGDQGRPTDRNWASVVIVVVGGVLVALLVILHLTGVVGPGVN